MIRRISKYNDLKDIINSCPSGVIDDIYAIEYYIDGYDEGISASFTKVDGHLEVILPTSQLQLLPNGILMRRAYYRVADTSYPDGYYNLEFEDNMNIWLGDDRGGAVVNEYVTDEELASTLSSYATQEWISSQDFLTAETLPSDIATQEWVESQGYLTAETIPSDIATESYVQSALSGFATESWVESQGYLTEHQDLTGYATESWVSDQGYLTTENLSGYATQSWVESQSYLTMSSIPSNLVTRSWVENQGYLSASDLSGYATESWVSSNFITIHQYESLNQYIGSVQNELYSLSEYVVSEFTAMGFDGVNPFATESYVSSYVQSYVDEQGFACEDPEDPFATEGYVNSQGFYIEDSEDPVATEGWVDSQGYYIEDGEDPVATQSYVDDAISGISAPENCVEYDPDDRLKDELDIDVIKRELDNGDEGNTVPYVLGQYVDSNVINTIQVDGQDLIRVNYETDPETGDLVETFREWPAYTDDEWDVVWNWRNPNLNDDDPLKDHGYVGDDFVVGRDDNGHFEGFGVVDMGGGIVTVGRYTRDEVEDGSLYLYNENIDPFLAYHIDSNDEVVNNVGSYFNIDDTGTNFLMGRFEANGDYFGGVKLNQYGSLGHYWVEEELIEDPEDPEGEGYYEYTSYFDPFATQDWVSDQGYLNSSALSSALSGYATESWVQSQGYLTTVPTGYATKAWVSQQGYLNASSLSSALSSALSDYVTSSWLESNYYFAAESTFGTFDPYSFNSNGFVLTEDGLHGIVIGSSTIVKFSISYPAGEPVETIEEFATQEWVTSQGYLTSHQDLSSYATQSWVSSQGYLSASDLSSYATQSWVSSNYLSQSAIWTGTESDWNLLTPAQQAAYTIALITD